MVQEGSLDVLIVFLRKQLQVGQEALGQEAPIDLVREVQKTLGEFKFLLLIRFLNKLADLLIRLILRSLVDSLLRGCRDLLLLLSGRLHGDVQAVLLLFHVPAADAPLLEFLIHPICLFVLKIEHLLINKHAVNGPTGVIRIGVVQPLNLEVVGLSDLQLDIDDLQDMVGAALTIWDVVIGDSAIL